MDQITMLRTLMTADPLRRKALAAVAALGLSDCWIGAGFVRDAVWDHLHGYEAGEPKGDVDVIWFDANSPDAELDHRIEQELRKSIPGFQWSVKNQARMHLRNGDTPYISVSDAMRHWPETATAVGVRLDQSGSLEINAPWGLDDLFALRLRPTPHFVPKRLPIFADRVSSKRWMSRYPKLVVETAAIGVVLEATE